MKTKHLLAYLAATGVLAACGGGESESSAPDINIDVEVVEVVGPDVPTDSITTTALPVVESFDTAASIEGFLSSSYKALSSESASDEEDGFYYSTGGVYQTDGTLDPGRGLWITSDSDAKLRLGNGRFTMGQIVSVLAEGEDLRRNTTPGGGVDDLVSWGELDLSQPYRVSFCLVDASVGGNLQVYVDNNSTTSGSSIHGSGSRILSEPVGTLTTGQRLVIESDVGTANSFLQLRVDSGGWVVLDDLVVEYQSDATSGTQPDCSAKSTTDGEVNPWVDPTPTPEPTATPEPTPTPVPTAEPSVPVESAAWGVFKGDAIPTATDSVSDADGSLGSFTDVDGTAATTWTATGGIASFVSTAAATKSRADFDSIVGDTFPKSFTLLMRMRNPNVANRGIEVEARFGGDDGAGNAGRIKFLLRESKIQLEKYDTSATAEFSMDTSAYHIYQVNVLLTDVRTATIYTWVDGTPVAEMSGLETTMLRDTTAGSNALSIGEGSDSNLFNADVDYVIWTADGAYGPDVLAGHLPADIGDITGYDASPAASATWGVFNGDAIPTAADSIATPAGGTATFVDTDGTAATTWTAASGIASFVSTDAATKSRVEYGSIVGDTFPKTYTLLMRMQNPNAGNRGIEVEAKFGGDDGSGNAGRVKFLLRESKIQLEKYDTSTTAEFSMDTTAYHIYQVNVTLSDVRTATIDTWVDGVAVAEMSGLSTTTLRDTPAGENEMTIGDGSDSNLFNANLDYVIWTADGAFAPADLAGQLPSGIGDTTGY